jgi:hypothetical protein
MEFREIYCMNCKKTLARYNVKFYSEDKIGEMVNTYHFFHVRNGHQIKIRKLLKETN